MKAREMVTLWILWVTCETIVALIAKTDTFLALMQDWVKLVLFVAVLGLPAFRVGRAIVFNNLFT